MIGFIESFDIVGSSFLTVIVSELGDKTFIATAMLAMKYSKSAVFAGNVLSMTLMMIFAAYIGYTVMVFIDPNYVKILSILVFVHFATISFWGAYKNSKEDEDINTGSHKNNWVSILWQTMVIVFFAEWGDKSQIGIIALSAIHPAMLVIIGAIAAILCCALTAIAFGKIFNTYVSGTHMEIVSGTIFLLFAVTSVKDYIAGSL
jgi:Ca2+/H+ antiporter, TMEM165/GDT1 family